MKAAIITATIMTICLLSISNAQEKIDLKEYGRWDILGEDDDFPHCTVETNDNVSEFDDYSIGKVRPNSSSACVKTILILLENGSTLSFE